MKVGSGQAKSSRDASVSEAPVCPPHSKEALGPGAQSSGSKSNVTSMVRLGRNMSIGGSPVEPRSVPDSPCPLDNGRSSQRTASPSMPGMSTDDIPGIILLEVVFVESIELSSNSTQLLVRRWLFWIQHLSCSVSLRCILGGVWRFGQ